MSTLNTPSIISPNGGESILTPEVEIKWIAANPLSTDITVFTQQYQIFFTDHYDPLKRPDWKQIAVVPSSVTTYLWRPRGVRSNSVRIGIRGINGRGETSQYAISAANFSIQRRKLALPPVVFPAPGHHIDQFVNIQTDDSAIVNTLSQRTYYQFYYSSRSAGIPSTSIAQNIPLGGTPVLWNTVNLPPANDYMVEVFLADDDGNTSDRLYIPVTIAHEGYFLLDTQPPEAAITVNNNDTFTQTRNVSVQIVSFDETTGVHSMQIEEGATKGSPDSIGPVRSFQLSDGDEVKAVELLLQDFGGNRNDQFTQRLFQVLVEVSGTEIADIAFDVASGVLWAVTSGTGRYLYKVVDFPSRKTTFSDTPTAVAVFNAQPYIAVKTDSDTGELLKFSDSQETIHTFATANSVVNCMEVHGTELFLGMENGSIYSYDGNTMSLIQTLSDPIRLLVSDGNLLYAVLKNNLGVYIYNGSSFELVSM